MDAQEFDRLTRVHATGASRRGVIAVLGGGLMSALSLALVGSAGVSVADAKGKKKHRRKKKHKHQSAGSPPPSTDPGSPSDQPGNQPPPVTGPGFCAPSTAAIRTTSGRFAQTFFPPQGGQLTSATVYLQKNPANFALGFQIRTVDATGIPTSTVLASRVIGNIPETHLADPKRAVTATFMTPATLALGQQYALTITGPGGVSYSVRYRADACADGEMFEDKTSNDTFVKVYTGAGYAGDLAYAVTVV